MKLQNNMSGDIATSCDNKDVEFNGQLFVDGQTEVKGSFSLVESHRGGENQNL